MKHFQVPIGILKLHVLYRIKIKLISISIVYMNIETDILIFLYELAEMNSPMFVLWHFVNSYNYNIIGTIENLRFVKLLYNIRMLQNPLFPKFVYIYGKCNL